jgi:hypothetical protein
MSSPAHAAQAPAQRISHLEAMALETPFETIQRPFFDLLGA